MSRCDGFGVGHDYYDLADENDGDDDVKFVIANNTNGFVESLGLLYAGGLEGDTAIEGFSGTGGTGQPTLILGECNPDNSGQSLNVCFDFPQPNAARFDAGDTVTFFLDSATASLLESLLTRVPGSRISMRSPAGRAARS